MSPLIKGGKTYEFLKEVSKGYDPHWRSNGDDPLIDEVKFSDRNPSNSKVVIKFEDDEVFLDTINVESIDDVYTYRTFVGNYSGRDYDTYGEEDRWKEGEFIEYHFNDENKRKALEIAKFYENRAELNGYRGIADILSEHFGRIVDDLIYFVESERTESRSLMDSIFKKVI